jgi:hypothetical protein
MVGYELPGAIVSTPKSCQSIQQLALYFDWVMIQAVYTNLFMTFCKDSEYLYQFFRFIAYSPLHR